MRLEIPKPKGNTRRERLLRGLAMLAVVGLVGWAFMQNSRNMLEKIQTEQAINDQTESIGKEDMEFLKGFITSFKQTYGIGTRIVIYKGEVLLPDPDPKILFIGLAPVQRRTILQFPTLLRPALGEDFINSLNDEFLESFEKDDWQRELKIALTMIWSRLSALEAQQQGNQ